MRQVLNAASTAIRFEGAVKNRQMLGFQSAANNLVDVSLTFFFNILDRVELLDVSNDAMDFRRAIAEALQGLRHSPVDNLQQTTARQQLVLNKRNIVLDPGCIAIHQESNRASRR